MNLKLITLFISLLYSVSSSAQTLPVAEKQLASWFDSMRQTTDYSQRVAYNDSIKQLFTQVLHQSESFVYPFDSLKFVGKVLSDDALMRVYTWNILGDSGSLFNGFIQCKTGEVSVFQQRDTPYLPDTKKTIRLNDWYGALYFRMIPYSFHKQKVYLLLGWSQYQPRTQYKLIDVLAINDLGEWQLGLPLFFDEEKKVASRVCLEYDIETVMHLDYEPARKRIVFDHLSFMKEYADEYVTLGPDMSVDAYVRKPKGWFLDEDIHVRNSRP